MQQNRKIRLVTRWTTGVIWAVVAILVLWPGTLWVRSEAPGTAATQPADGLSEAENSLARLKAGNERFVDNQPLSRDFSQGVRASLAQGQHPFAIILTCADSRVPPELIFDQSIGDLFVARVAGNVIDPVVLGSVEYAITVLKSPLVVVMGHEDCGAVKAALGGKDAGPNIQAFLERIRPGIQKVKADAPGALGQAITDNVRHVGNSMPQESDVIRKALDDQRVKIVGAVYSITTGKITWLE